jgi:predicted RNase H-like HicB family nuclease
MTLTEDGFGTVFVLCPDVPEAMTHAGNRVEAAGKARGALQDALDLYRLEGRAIPRPCKAKGDFTVAVEVDPDELEQRVVNVPAGSAGPRRRMWAMQY